MAKIVILPGGYHPFHTGHMSLYNAAHKAFPDADIYIAASADTKTRPFPFNIKRNLAVLSGVDSSRFIQVKSPFSPAEITSKYDPKTDVVIFVRSEKDKNESPIPGTTLKNGQPSYYLPYTQNATQPFSKHAYIAYLPTVDFAGGLSSATDIRNAWPKMQPQEKQALIVQLYPRAKNEKLINNIVSTFDQVLGSSISESSMDSLRSFINRVKPLLPEASVEQKQHIVSLLEATKSRLLDRKESSSSVDDLLSDPEERAALMYAKQHYPSAPDTQAAFVKFVLHSLKHSREDDERQDSEIDLLLKRVNSLQDQLDDVKDNSTESINEDYLSEK